MYTATCRSHIWLFGVYESLVYTRFRGQSLVYTTTCRSHWGSGGPKTRSRIHQWPGGALSVSTPPSGRSLVYTDPAWQVVSHALNAGQTEDSEAATAAGVADLKARHENFLKRKRPEIVTPSWRPKKKHRIAVDKSLRMTDNQVHR